jgi:phosphoribosylanthranilate isomerase
MSVFVKICGLTTPDAIEAAVRSGADAIGFVFAESPRRVTVAQARELAELLPPAVARVAVMRHPTQREWIEIETEFAPDWLQTDAEDFAGLDIGADIKRLPVYRDTPALDADAAALEPMILFEGAVSGDGRQADWQRAKTLAARTRLILAGGLDPQNVADAVRQVSPWGVDVSSGVERTRGRKDPEKIAAFVNAAHNVERSDGN